MENVRERARREVALAKQFAIQNFSKDLLTVADCLEMALQSVKSVTFQEESAKQLVSGVDLTEKELQKVFSRYGVLPIDPAGVKFDPNRHQALFEVDDSTKEPGIVAAVMKRGYALHDRTIRPAQVGVVKSRGSNSEKR